MQTDFFFFRLIFVFVVFGCLISIVVTNDAFAKTKILNNIFEKNTNDSY